MKKVLIITYYWPPAGGSGVQRWLKFVKYFRNYNIEPVVFTAQNAAYPILDYSLENEIPASTQVVQQKIIEPYKWLSAFKKSNRESSGFLDNNKSIFTKLKHYIRANCFIPDARIFWVKPSVKKIEKVLKSQKIDTIITTGPPHSVHLIGLKIKKRQAINWIADFRDPWTEIDYFHHLPLTNSSKRKHLQLEQDVLKNANLVTVVSPYMQKKYKKINPNVEVVTNGYDQIDGNNQIQLDEDFSITHIGLMNADRNPVKLWKVLSEICKQNKTFKQKLKIKLIGLVDETVKNSIEKYQLKNQVVYNSYLPHQKIAEYQKQSQVLLLVVNKVPFAKGIVTGKIFEYLIAKRPILAIAPENGDLAKIIKSTQSGLVTGYENEKLMKEVLLNYFNQFEKNQLKVNSVNLEQYHRKNLTENMSKLIYNL
ncbi:MAG: glycosyl transferase family 1 [Lutibacter sp.]